MLSFFNILFGIILFQIRISHSESQYQHTFDTFDLKPPDIDHDYRFNWVSAPAYYYKPPYNSLRGETLPSVVRQSISVEPERKSFLDTMWPSPEALMAASGVSMMQNVMSASMPYIPKAVTTFFNINKLLNGGKNFPILKSRSYEIPMAKYQVFERNIAPIEKSISKKNVFDRPIVVIPEEVNNGLDSIQLDTMVQEIDTASTTTIHTPLNNATSLQEIEGQRFVNSDFVGIPAPPGWVPRHENFTVPHHQIHSKHNEQTAEQKGDRLVIITEHEDQKRRKKRPTFMKFNRESFAETKHAKMYSRAPKKHNMDKIKPILDQPTIRNTQFSPSSPVHSSVLDIISMQPTSTTTVKPPTFTTVQPFHSTTKRSFMLYRKPQLPPPPRFKPKFKLPFNDMMLDEDIGFIQDAASFQRPSYSTQQYYNRIPTTFQVNHINKPGKPYRLMKIRIK